MSQNESLIVRPPKHEALWPTDLFQVGIGSVIVARFKSGGTRVEAGVFLLDVWCLGVKSAFYATFDRDEYLRDFRADYISRFDMVSLHPACARKLVEQARDYALDLGFTPHADFKQAARVFGGISAAECTNSFTFGDQGKPHYIAGPRATEEQSRRIARQLEKRCGAGNYHFTIPVGDPGLEPGDTYPG